MILNPVDPNDNYADSWTDETAEEFFRWVTALNNDFVLLSTENLDRYFAALKSSLGLSFVERVLPNSKHNHLNHPRQIINQAKPWRK